MDENLEPHLRSKNERFRAMNPRENIQNVCLDQMFTWDLISSNFLLGTVLILLFCFTKKNIF